MQREMENKMLLHLLMVFQTSSQHNRSVNLIERYLKSVSTLITLYQFILFVVLLPKVERVTCVLFTVTGNLSCLEILKCPGAHL